VIGVTSLGCSETRSRHAIQVDTVDFVPSGRRSSYRVELIATFEMTIDEIVEGPAGLSRTFLEDVIEQNWWWLSGSTNVLLESSWILEDFEELPR
jgi:hypothetical protein